jgi:hypothetical protein
MGDHPVNVTVWGDSLESPYVERPFFELDDDALLPPLSRPLDRVQREVG